jgi:predicted transcriptional regulator
MQVIIELNAEVARQLDAIQNHTNQDRESVIEQGIGLYYQQLQPHREFYIDTKKQYELTCSVPANTSSN